MRPERVLLFRSARHLCAAIDALQTQSPGCEVTVVATPGADAALDHAGVPVDRRIVYTCTPFFQPVAFLTSQAGVRAFRGRFDRVCVLWSDPDGVGHANVDQTALLLSPGGFTAITPDGRLVRRRTARLLAQACTRAAASLAVRGILLFGLFVPAWAWEFVRRPLRGSHR